MTVGSDCAKKGRGWEEIIWYSSVCSNCRTLCPLCGDSCLDCVLGPWVEGYDTMRTKFSLEMPVPGFDPRQVLIRLNRSARNDITVRPPLR